MELQKQRKIFAMIPKFRIYNHNTQTYADVDIINYPEEFVIDTLGTLHKLKDCALLQSTGKLDCNKKEMYVGDIVKAYFVSETGKKDYDLMRVTSEYYSFGIKGLSTGHFVGFFEELDVPDDEYEIIGNIFENEVTDGK